MKCVKCRGTTQKLVFLLASHLAVMSNGVSLLSPTHRDTVEFVRRAEHVGAAWISVHGRTSKQRAEPANMDAIKLVRFPRLLSCWRVGRITLAHVAL